MFSGQLPNRFLNALKAINIATIHPRTFFRHQKKYLHHAVNNVWLTQRNNLFASLQGSEVIIGGDGRCDSMGHSAKYGSYTGVDLVRNKVLTVELVQSTQVKSSNNMELKGLQMMFHILSQFNIVVKALVTDRHKQIAKWVRENMPGVKHYYDCWHVAKSIKKKLQNLAKKKPCSLVGEWTKSVINHFYWCVQSTEPGNKVLVEAKWKSLLNHVQNKHEHDGIYPKCLHQPLTEDQARLTKWFKPDTEAYDSLAKIVDKKDLVKDISQCSAYGQTSTVEGYHSLVNQFAPKMYHFHFHGMHSRLLLAALHYNENSGRPQKRNHEGKLEFVITYPKYKEGGHIVRKILTDCSYNYVDSLFVEVLAIINNPLQVVEPLPDVPPPLCSKHTRPDKQQAIEQHSTRF